METITVIPKEQLKDLNFFKSDVLNDVSMRQKRRLNLNRAMLLGNLEHNKVKINFLTEDGTLHQVETTIWGLTQNFILLKGGVSIPIRSVVKLDF
ncbi:hypothetical protein BH23BAC1_BH23BAC1_12440 [soil metagenome]